MGDLALADAVVEDGAVLHRELLLVEPLLRPPSRLQRHRQLHLLLGGEEAITADLVEVHPHGVGNGDVGDLVEVHLHLGPLLGEADPPAPQRLQDVLERLARSLGVLQFLLDLGHGQEAALAPALREGRNHRFERLAHLRFLSRCNAIKRLKACE